jgi:UDP-glucose 4-epimerase
MISASGTGSPGSRVLVSGSTGFVGRALCAALSARGYTVLPYSTKEGKDITNFEEVKRQMKDADYVFHLAAELDEKSSNLHAVNVSGTRNMLEAAAKQKVRKFVFLSTTGVLGSFSGCADESFPYNPVTPYEKSKAEAEKLVLAYQEATPVVVLRSALVLGPNKYWKQIVRLVEKGFPVIGSGKNCFQTIYVKNLADALMVCLEKGELGETYNAVDSARPTLNELYGRIAEELGISAKPKHLPKIIATLLAPFIGKGIVTKEHIGRLCRNRCYGNSKLKAIGWRERYGLKEAVRETVSAVGSGRS